MRGLLPISIIFLYVMLFLSPSCGTEHKAMDSIEKFPTDTLDVFCPLIPEDSLHSIKSFRGFPVAKIKDSIPTKDSMIYITMNIVELDQNPKITSNLLSFAIFNLVDRGFLPSRDSLLSEKYNDRDFKDRTAQEVLNQFSDLVSKEFYAQLPTILSYECGFNMEINIYPVFLNDEYVTYCKDAYYYTGGAHGNYSRFLQTYNVKTGETIDLEDMVLPEKLGEFREAVVKHMAASYPIGEGIKTVTEYLDSLNSWFGLTNLEVALGVASPDDLERITIENYPLNDPGITDVGLVVCYEKYALTPGVYGCPTIVISYDEVRDCLKPPFNKYPSKFRGSR